MERDLYTGIIKEAQPVAQGSIKRLITASRFGFIRADQGEDISFDSLTEGQRIKSTSHI